MIRDCWLNTLPWLAPLVIVLAGCGRAGDFTAVEGIVMLEGKPLAGVTIILIPEGTTGRSAFGTARQDGSFRLATSDSDGASPGNYRVIIGVVAPERPGPRGNLAKEEMLTRQKAMQAMSSGKLSVPPVYSNAAMTPLRCTVPVQGKLVLELRSAGR
jgi:hypothetical protein